MRLRKSGLVSQIDLSDKSTWENSVFLTFDIDWAHDDVVADTLDVVESFGIKATWFYTHKSKMIDVLKELGHEVGIHPNFNLCLGCKSDKTSLEIIQECCNFVASPFSSRSHSLVYGSPIAQDLFVSGVKLSSNFCIPHSAEIALAPWVGTSGLVEVPYSWADEFMWSDIDQAPILSWLKLEGLLVCDFHPIHVYLNTAHLDHYESTRDIHKNPQVLKLRRNLDTGTRNQLIDLCSAIS